MTHHLTRAVGTGIVLVLSTASCGDAEPVAPTADGLRMVFGAIAELRPDGLAVQCTPSVVGEGLNRGETVTAVAVEFENESSTIRQVALVGEATDGVTFEAVPIGTWEVDVTVCGAGDVPRWRGRVANLEVPDQGEVSADVYLTPTDAWACPGRSEPDDPGRYNRTALTFAAAAADDEGEIVTVAGGLSDWTGNVDGLASATDEISFFVRSSGVFCPAGGVPACGSLPDVQLASPRALAKSVRVGGGRGGRLLLVGGTTAVAENNLDPNLRNLIKFGPPPEAEVPVPELIDLATGQTQLLSEMQQLRDVFAPGAGVSSDQETDVVLVAGGISLAGANPVVSDQATLIEITSDSVRFVTFDLVHGRVGPAIVAIAPRVFMVIGGNTTHSDLEDPAAQDRLIEIVDARGARPVALATRLEFTAPETAELAIPTAFPEVVTTSDGQVVVIGGLPILSSTLGVSRTPDLPNLFRVSGDVDLTAVSPLTISITSPATYTVEQTAEMSRRVFPSRLVVDGSAWLVGGARPTAETPFLPRADSMLVAQTNGVVSAGDATPLASTGGVGVQLRGGASLLAFGLVEPAPVQLAATNAAILRASSQGLVPCSPGATQ